MGSGEKSLRHFHLHLPHLHHHGKKQVIRDVPKGCLAIKVGQGEEQQRVVVPVIYFNHPLFMQLLKEAEEEYGFDQKGTITIPCHVEEFRYVQGLIDRENSLHHHHHVGCFRVWLLLLLFFWLWSVVGGWFAKQLRPPNSIYMKIWMDFVGIIHLLVL